MQEFTHVLFLKGVNTLIAHSQWDRIEMKESAQLVIHGLNSKWELLHNLFLQNSVAKFIILKGGIETLEKVAIDPQCNCLLLIAPSVCSWSNSGLLFKGFVKNDEVKVIYLQLDNVALGTFFLGLAWGSSLFELLISLHRPKHCVVDVSFLGWICSRYS